MLLLALLLLPLLAGGALCFMKGHRKGADALFVSALGAEAALALSVLILSPDGITLFRMTEELDVSLKLDTVGKVFLSVAAFGFVFAGVYALRYLRDDERKSSFYALMLLSQGMLIGMDLSANLITMYMFFEMATLLSMPLVLHDRSEESIRAALKYLFYSVAGAFLALLAIFVLSHYTVSLDFTAGGTLDAGAVSGHEGFLLTVIFLGVVGFCAKAGMYPLHGWLPTAHPVAPAPASAVLSGVITKAGALAALRMIYYIVGTDFLLGTWVQYTWLGLSLLTVFMGSMMAYREDVLKKRLAYSSVSQLSYVLTGFFLMQPSGLEGGLLHVLFHACMKIGLFLVAGSFLTNLKEGRVSELKGVGRVMPLTLWAYTVLSLGLIGIPPLCGFVSKWYLALGALDGGLPVFTWLVPVILLISALLTAGYLLPLTVRGFFPGKDFKSPARSNEGGLLMWVPLMVLAGLCLLLGVFAAPLAESFRTLAETLM